MITYTKRNCDWCKKEYLADNRNLKRGWGLCCSKSCAANKRESKKPKKERYVNRKRKWSIWDEAEHRVDMMDAGFDHTGGKDF